MSEPATVVLVHGAWHGAWCWEKVVPLLEAAGVPAVAVDLPLTSLHDDAQAIRNALDHVDGTVTLTRDGAVNALYHDCDPIDIKAALTRLRPMNLTCVTTPVGVPAWRVKPSTYVVCAEDRGVHPDLQRLLAGRCTSSVEWPTAHSPFLNRPDLVASLLTELANGET